MQVEIEAQETENTDTVENADLQDQDAEQEESESENNSDESEAESDTVDEKKEEEGEVRPKKKNGVQKRINKLNQRVTDSQKETEYWKGVALQQKNQDKEPESKSTKENTRPNSDDFESHDDYIESLTDWKLDQKLADQNAKAEQQKETERVQVVAKTWKDRLDQFSDQTPDFEEAIEASEDVVLSGEVQQAIVESDLGPRLLYELAKNSELSQKISSMSTINAIKELGKIEARFESSSSKKIGNNQITKAPRPLATIRGGVKITKDISDPSLSQREYEALRLKQLERKSS